MRNLRIVAIFSAAVAVAGVIADLRATILGHPFLNSLTLLWVSAAGAAAIVVIALALVLYANLVDLADRNFDIAALLLKLDDGLKEIRTDLEELRTDLVVASRANYETGFADGESQAGKRRGGNTNVKTLLPKQYR
jgi:hypothetical protein